MKLLIILTAAIFLMVSTSISQELGVRFGNVTGGHVAIDGIVGLGEFSRVHGDVSFYSGGVGVEGLWNFIYRPLSKEGFDYYVGAGPFVWLQSPFGFGAAGELGLDYHFKDAPISLSADWRPSWQLVDHSNFDADIFGFNVRYVFNSGK